MISVGDASLGWASCTASYRFSNVEYTARCSGVHPFSTAAAGVFLGRPPKSSVSTVLSNVLSPMYITSVVFVSNAVAMASSMSDCPFSRACPVRNRTLVASVRCVSGIPSSAPMAHADVIPGTTPTSMPRERRYRASSPPRPNMKGSPPFKRTTVLLSSSSEANIPISSFISS